MSDPRLMNQPKWQKAKILACLSHPEIIGREVWVMRPAILSGTDELTGDYIHFQRMTVGAFRAPCGDRAGFPPENLELLARSENDFAEAVVIQSWEEFLNA